MKRLLAVFHYCALLLLSPFIISAVLLTFVIVLLDWYCETVQNMLDQLEVICG